MKPDFVLMTMSRCFNDNIVLLLFDKFENYKNEELFFVPICL